MNENAQLDSTMSLLMDLGANISTKDKHGNSLLHKHILSKEEKVDIKIKNLLDNGIDCLSPNNANETPLNLAIKVDKYVDLIYPYAQQRRADLTVLALNINFNHSQALFPKEMILETFANLDKRDFFSSLVYSLYVVSFKSVSDTLFLIRAKCAREKYENQWSVWKKSPESISFFGNVNSHLSSGDKTKAEKVDAISNEMKILDEEKNKQGTANKSTAISLLTHYHIWSVVKPQQTQPVVEIKSATLHG